MCRDLVILFCRLGVSLLWCLFRFGLFPIMLGVEAGWVLVICLF